MIQQYPRYFLYGVIQKSKIVFVYIHHPFNDYQFITFEGLSTIFIASNECFLQHKFTYFSQRYSLLVIIHTLKLPAKYFLLIIKPQGTHIIVLYG